MSLTGSLVHYDSNGYKMAKKVRLDTSVASSAGYQSPPPSNHNASSSSCVASSKGREKQPRDSHRIHLNTLWSIWYGILVTLFQGFLVVQGAHRFLSCTLITWKMDVPTFEINLQLILCVAAIIFLPLFLASSFFKVGNLANDGFKLGDNGKNCSSVPENGLEHESRGGTCRTLWTHGGPTSAFIHILTALCLLIPRLLLESRLIQDGFLPKENIWRTELDFMVTHRDRLVILSFMTSPYKNLTTEHPNQSLSDIIESDFGNSLDETRLIEQYREKVEANKDYDLDLDEDEDDDELFDLSQELDNDSFITFSTDTEPFNDTFPPPTTTESVTSPSTSTSTEAITSTRRSGGRKKPKNGRNRSSSSEEIDLRPTNNRPRKRPRPTPTDFASAEETTFAPKKKLKESNIKFVRPEKVPENAIPSTPVSTNSKIIEIKPSQGTKNLSRKSRHHSDADLEFEIQSIYEDDFIIRDSDTGEIIKPAFLLGEDVPENISLRTQELTGIAGFIHRILGQQESFDQVKWHRVPSLEFLNLCLALLVWSVRYPSVFWAASKSFTCIFSIQMAASALDIILCYAGVSVLYRHQTVGDHLPMPGPPLLLNATVSLSLYLLAVLLILCSSMILYLYGHGRLSNVVRERRHITLKGSDHWCYFAHCASFCFVLAIAVVKAPLMYDFAATYRGSLDSAVLAAALGSVSHLFIWILIWLALTAKRRWQFKLPPLEDEAVCQPLLQANCSGSQRPDLGRTGSEESSGSVPIYWPKINPDSPKLRVTFNEVPTDDGAHNGKRNPPLGSALRMPANLPCGEPDDGDYATLRGPNGTLLISHQLHHAIPEYGNLTDHADDTSEEGKLLACVRDDSVTYASTRDLEPPMSSATLSPATSYINTSEHLMSPVSVVTVHSSEVQVASVTPRFIRRADSGMPPEALTPRSDTETESSTSPPERASSESSGVHSSEEGKDEVVIRPRPAHKTIVKPGQPAIQEEPFGRSTNMRMSSFNADAIAAATLPISRTSAPPTDGLRSDYQCSTMPLPLGGHASSKQPLHPMYQSVAGSKVQLHTTLPNGVPQGQYASSHYMRGRVQTKLAGEVVYGHTGHRTFSKLLNEPLISAPTMNSFQPVNHVVLIEDRDSANYSMISDQDREMYMNTAHLQQLHQEL